MRPWDRVVGTPQRKRFRSLSHVPRPRGNAGPIGGVVNGMLRRHVSCTGDSSRGTRREALTGMHLVPRTLAAAAVVVALGAHAADPSWSAAERARLRSLSLASLGPLRSDP